MLQTYKHPHVNCHKELLELVLARDSPYNKAVRKESSVVWIHGAFEMKREGCL